MKRALYNNSKAGIKNANVFPEPVYFILKYNTLAAPNKSRPFNKCGIDLD